MFFVAARASELVSSLTSSADALGASKLRTMISSCYLDRYARVGSFALTRVNYAVFLNCVILSRLANCALNVPWSVLLLLPLPVDVCTPIRYE